MKKYSKSALKIIVSGLALYFVFRKIDPEETKSIFLSLNLLWLIPATLLFVVSKLVSAVRLNRFFRLIELRISEQYNARLYWIGMFYNLFLPGGIGGDGYKVYLLHKQYDTPVKKLLAATLLDRINGLYALLFLALALGIFIGPVFPYQKTILISLLLLSVPVWVLFNKYLFQQYFEALLPATMLSLVVQFSQLCSAYFILLSLGIVANQIIYQFVFLISSIVAVIPFTIGGVGARELTFIFSDQYLEIDKNAAVAFSLIFFVITAVSSLPGLLLKEKTG